MNHVDDLIFFSVCYYENFLNKQGKFIPILLRVPLQKLKVSTDPFQKKKKYLTINIRNTPIKIDVTLPSHPFE